MSQPLGFPALVAWSWIEPDNGTGRAHKLALHSTPEIHYGSNGFRFLTCFEVPLQGYYPT